MPDKPVSPHMETEGERGSAKRTQEDTRVLEMLGGDPRVLALFGIALTAYTWLPDGMIDLTNGEDTRTKIVRAIEAFGFRAREIPWHRFPRRFQKNKPKLQLFDSGLTDEKIEQYFDELIELQMLKGVNEMLRTRQRGRLSAPAKARGRKASVQSPEPQQASREDSQGGKES